MHSSGPRRVLLLDEHEIFRLGVRSALSESEDLDVVAEAGSLAEALSLVAATRPSVAVVSIREHGEPVLDRLSDLRAQHPPMRVLVLSRAKEELLTAALRGGADGYLLNDIPAEQLAIAVRSIADGDTLIDPACAIGLTTRRHQATTFSEQVHALTLLTPQELKILALIGEGMTNQQIADRLYLVEKTVRNHVTRLLAKLGVERRTQAALLAARFGVGSDRPTGDHGRA